MGSLLLLYFFPHSFYLLKVLLLFMFQNDGSFILNFLSFSWMICFSMCILKLWFDFFKMRKSFSSFFYINITKFFKRSFLFNRIESEDKFVNICHLLNTFSFLIMSFFISQLRFTFLKLSRQYFDPFDSFTFVSELIFISIVGSKMCYFLLRTMTHSLWRNKFLWR